MKPQADGRLLGIREAATQLGIPYDTVYRLIKAGTLPCVQFPGIKRLYVDRADLSRLVDRFKETATS